MIPKTDLKKRYKKTGTIIAPDYYLYYLINPLV